MQRPAWLVPVAVACGPGTGPGPEAIEGVEWVLDEARIGVVRLTWEQAAPAEIEVQYQPEDGDWTTLRTVEGASGINETAVVGVPFGQTGELRLLGPSGEAVPRDRRIEIPMPKELPVPSVEIAEPTGWYEPGRYLLTSISQAPGGWSSRGPFWTVIYDRAGRPVWARKSAPRQWTLYAQVSVTGDHILFDEFRWLGVDDEDPAVVFRSYLDEPITSVPVLGHHHAFIELPDGTLAWGSRGHGGGEALVERAPGSDTDTIVWTCAEDWPEAERCTSNSLYYDEARGTYLYSFYTVEAVAEIDRATGETLWWAGDVPGGLSFAPEESQFVWQHGATFTPEGNLLLSTHDADKSTNLAREYAIDLEAGTLTEVWSYDAQAYAATNGDLWRLANGNSLHTLGSASEIREVDAEGETVWHLDFEGTRLLGRSELIEDLSALLAPP